MVFLSTKLGPLTVVQVLILLVVLGGTTAVAFYAADRFGTTGGNGIAEGEQLVPAQFGDLTNVVSTDGSITFPEVESAVFETAGEVGEVLVTVGDLVSVGQVIARLDSASIASLEKRVADARVKLRDTDEKLASAGGVDPLALARAEESVAKATLAVQSAQEDLEEMTAGATDDEVADAQAAIDTATTSLANASGSLDIANRDWADRLQAAVDDVETKAAAYSEVFVDWLGITLTGEESAETPAALLTSWGADLEALFGSGRTVNDLSGSLAQPADDPATRWSEPVVHSWLTFFPGQILPTCDGTAIPAQGVCVQRQIDDAWAALDGSRDGQATTGIDSAKAVTAAEESVTKAQKALDAAIEAKESLSEAADPLAIGVEESGLSVAQANLIDAKAALAELTAGTDPLDLALMRADLATNALALEQALADLAGAELTAPIAGVVAEVGIEAGDNALGQGSRTIVIVDETVVEIDGVVDEIDILSIAVGVQAEVTLSALPGQTLRGTVTEIGTPTNQQGVVTFPVSVQLDVPDGLVLLEGLTATASIVTSQIRNVLLVPNAAIQGSFIQPFVRVSAGGVVVERQVELGAADDFWVVVTAGLVEGEQVAMPEPSSGQTGFGAFTFGGGFGGGGGRVFRQLQGGRDGGRGGGQGGGGQGGGQGSDQDDH
jgi:HlyD family secretion protein